MNTALAEVLARPDIWRGDQIAVAPAPTLSSGFARLDAELPGGGWPRGQLTELLSQQCGIGELSLLLPALAALTAAGETVVLIAPPYVLHAPAWAAAGIRLDALCLVFPQRARDGLWAAVQALRCGGVAATLAWLDGSGRESLAQNSVRRLQVAAGEGSGCAFLMRPPALVAASSPAPLRLHLEPAGQRLRVNLLKRRGAPARQPVWLDIPRPWRPLRRDAVPIDVSAHAVADAGFSRTATLRPRAPAIL